MGKFFLKTFLPQLLLQSMGIAGAVLQCRDAVLQHFKSMQHSKGSGTAAI